MAKKAKAQPAPKIETHKITSREAWLKLREADTTASAAGALLGVHDYETAYGLFLEKTGQREPISESEPMRRGRHLEPVAVAILREDYPQIEFTQPGVYLRDPAARLGATPDLFAVCPERGKGVVQIKSVAEPVFRSKWLAGDEMDPERIEPPLWIVVQAAIESALTEGAKWAAVAPLVVGFGISCPLIDIPLGENTQRLLAGIRRASLDFWAKVEAGIAPEFDYEKDGAALAALYGVSNGQTIDLSGNNRIGELLAADADAAERAKAAAIERKAIKNEILAIMGENEFAYHPEWSLTFKTQHRAAYEVKPTSFRVMQAKRKN